MVFMLGVVAGISVLVEPSVGFAAPSNSRLDSGSEQFQDLSNINRNHQTKEDRAFIASVE